MKQTTALVFLRSVGIMLIITGLAKTISAMGGAKILSIKDPILNISFGAIYFLAGGLELVIGLLCLRKKGLYENAVTVAWLSTCFFVYRCGLLLMHYHKPCSCLGNLTDAIGVPPQFADLIMKSVVLYMIIGSYVILLTRRNLAVPSTNAHGASIIST